MNRIDKAFAATNRQDFLQPETRDDYDIDAPLPIGYGQTNSQPSTVRSMLIWLDPEAGEKILDVGSGSGWTAALLSNLVGPTGTIYAVEVVPQLARLGAANNKKAGVQNTHFYQAHETIGLPAFAPFDRILVSAAASELPHELVAQLKIGGRMVIPIGNSIYVIDKTSSTSYERRKHSGYVFVPLLY